MNADTRQRANTNKNVKKKKKGNVFARTFVVTLGLLTILTLTGWFVLTNLPGNISLLDNIITPPDIPSGNSGKGSGGTGAKPPVPGDDPAHIVPEGNEEDASIGDGRRTPEGFTDEDRKHPMFYTFLIFGLDEGNNTDTIMVASYDGETRQAHLIGIPRDSKVNVKRTTKKINAAFPVGYTYDGGFDGGVSQLKREIKTIIGFIPDYYICVDLNAFVKLVEAVGGVDVYVPRDMVYDDPIQNFHVNIKKGNRHLNGEDALKFARFRKSNDGNHVDDYDRIVNQQTVITAALQNALKPENLNKAADFVTIFTENVRTDLKFNELLWFATELNYIKDKGVDSISMHTLPTCGTSGLPDWYEFIDAAAVVKLVNETVNPYAKDIEEKNLDIIAY